MFGPHTFLHSEIWSSLPIFCTPSPPALHPLHSITITSGSKQIGNGAESRLDVAVTRLRNNDRRGHVEKKTSVRMPKRTANSLSQYKYKTYAKKMYGANTKRLRSVRGLIISPHMKTPLLFESDQNFCLNFQSGIFFYPRLCVCGIKENKKVKY